VAWKLPWYLIWHSLVLQHKYAGAGVCNARTPGIEPVNGVLFIVIPYQVNG
jgi:hypothetical protein